MDVEGGEEESERDREGGRKETWAAEHRKSFRPEDTKLFTPFKRAGLFLS